MNIYYYGELIEENGRKVTNQTNTTETDKLTLAFAAEEPAPEPKKTGMDSIGDILKDLDLNLDIYHPFQKVLQ